MSVATLPPIPHCSLPHPTAENLDWADIPIVDVSAANTPEGRASLVSTIRDAMHSVGMFYAVNHGLPQPENDRIRDIANAMFTEVSEDEKKIYAGQSGDPGKYSGYHLRGHMPISNGVSAAMEKFNGRRGGLDSEYPAAIRPFLPEIRAFSQLNHDNIVNPVLQILASGMDLPENEYVERFRPSEPGCSYDRCAIYYPRSEEDEAKTDNVWLNAHADDNLISILWSQPVSAQQIMTPNGEWRWVKHVDNAAIFYAGKLLETSTNGFYKAVLHRVVRPPADQQGLSRLCIFAFVKHM